MLGMSHTKAVVVVPSCSIIVHPETLMKTKSLLLGMWSCNSRNDGEQCLWLDGVHPKPQTDVQVRWCRKRLHGSWRMLLSWGCQSQFWVMLGTTRQCWDDLPQPGAAVWDEVPQPPPAQLNPPASFLGSEAHEEPSQGWSHSGSVPLWGWGAGMFSQNFPTSFHVPAMKQWLCECGLGDLADLAGRFLAVQGIGG